jgi:hypothetical protein
MRGQTLFVGNLVGEGAGIDFSDGTLQTTAYLGTTSEGIIPNQLTIKNSTNSTEVVISAGQNSSGTLTNDSIYYTALNPLETSSASLYHFFEGDGVNIDGILNVGGTTTLNGALNVTNATNLNSSLTVIGTSSLEGITGSSLLVSGATSLASVTASSLINSGTSSLMDITSSSLSVSGATTLGSTASNSTVLSVDGKISQLMLNGNTALGYAALSSQSSSTSGGENTAVGYQSLTSTTSGIGNTSVGYDTLLSCNSGSGNTAFGAATLGYVTEGSNNTSIGATAGNSIITGSNNICLGAGSDITDGVSNSTVIGAGVTTSTSNQICLGTSSNNAYIPGSLTVGGQATMDANLNVNALTTLTTAVVNLNLAVAGTSTFTSGFACGNQTTPYIMLIGTASVAYGGNALDALVSDSTNTNVSSVCTFNNSISFPTTIVGGYVNTNSQYIWASFIGGVADSTNQITVSFINFGQNEGSFPDTISFVCWGV